MNQASQAETNAIIIELELIFAGSARHLGQSYEIPATCIEKN